MSSKLAEVGGKLVIGGASFGASWLINKGIDYAKEQGYDVPEWVEQIGPAAVSLGVSVLGGMAGRPNSSPGAVASAGSGQ